MPSQSSGPVTTFLMFVPLVAVPALAIFGLPEIRQVTSLVQNAEAGPMLGASADPEQLLDQSTDDLVSPVRNDIRRVGANGSYETSVRDPGPAGATPLSLPPRQRVSSNQGMSSRDRRGAQSWSPPPQVLDEWDPSPSGAPDEKAPGASPDDWPADEPGLNDATARAEPTRDESPFRPIDEFSEFDDSVDDDRSSKASPVAPWDTPASSSRDGARAKSLGEELFADRSGASPAARPRGESRSAPEERRAGIDSDDQAHDPLTWKSAVKRLKALGIRDFHLQPGHEGNAFHFSCSYASPDQPRVTRRFEAEAAEPLQAVSDVLAQVEALAGQ